MNNIINAKTHRIMAQITYNSYAKYDLALSQTPKLLR